MMIDVQMCYILLLMLEGNFLQQSSETNTAR